MPGDDQRLVDPRTPAEPNALSRAMGLLGDEWTLMLLRHALLGATRYSDFCARIPISNAVLTARLEVLVREELFERRVYQDKPVRAEYVLTAKGRSVWPILVMIWSWERRWVPEHPYPTPPMEHRLCGRTFTPQYCCAHCGKQVDATGMDSAWGPSGGWRRSVPEVRTRRRSTSRGRRGERTFYPDTMAVFGNRWSSAVVGAAFLGVHRFKDFEEALGTPPSLLADRLAALTEQGIFQQVQLERRPDWAEYRFTAKGLDFFPVIAALIEWSERWYAADEGPVIAWTHRDCGAPFKGVLTCDQCGEPLAGADVALQEE